MLPSNFIFSAMKFASGLEPEAPGASACEAASNTDINTTSNPIQNRIPLTQFVDVDSVIDPILTRHLFQRRKSTHQKDKKATRIVNYFLMRCGGDLGDGRNSAFVIDMAFQTRRAAAGAGAVRRMMATHARFNIGKENLTHAIAAQGRGVANEAAAASIVFEHKPVSVVIEDG